MPSPAEILAALARIANTWWPIAVAWHVVLAAAVIALLSGWRPSQPTVGVLLALPLISVGAAAMVDDNIISGPLFIVLAGLLKGFAVRLRSLPATRSVGWPFIAGLILFAFGWVYPHFLGWGLPWSYLYAAPVGLVPCPTLSVVIGLR